MKRLVAGVAALACSAVLALPGGASAAGEWRSVPLPFLWPTNGVEDLSAQAADSVWIAGFQGRFCVPGLTPYSCVLSSPGNPVVRKWDGAAWREFPLRDAPQGPINDVESWGSEVWISDINGYLARFDGAAFQKVATPMGLSASPLAVNPAGVWVKQFVSSTGAGGQFRWNGSGWTQTPLPGGMTGISGPVTSIVAGEAWALSSVGGAAHLLRWDGSAWADAAVLPTYGQYTSVKELVATGPGEATVIVDPPNTTSDVTHVHRFKDGAWTDISPGGGIQINNLRVDGLGALYGIGLKIYKYDGTSWQEQAFPSGTYPSRSVPGSDAFWGFRGSPAGVTTNS